MDTISVLILQAPSIRLTEPGCPIASLAAIQPLLTLVRSRTEAAVKCLDSVRQKNILR